jgi:hypothetical protein
MNEYDVISSSTAARPANTASVRWLQLFPWSTLAFNKSDYR